MDSEGDGNFTVDETELKQSCVEPNPNDVEPVQNRTEGGAAGEGEVKEGVAEAEGREVGSQQRGDSSVATAGDSGTSEKMAVDEEEKELSSKDEVAVEEKELEEKTAETMVKKDELEAPGDLEQVKGVETEEPRVNPEKSQSSKESLPSNHSPPAPLSAAMSSPTHVPSKHTSFQAHLEASSSQPATSSKASGFIVSLPLSKVELVQHISIQCYSSFHPGDIVWAKGAQLPAWPGAVIDHKEWKRDKLKPAPPGKVSGGGKKPWI